VLGIKKGYAEADFVSTRPASQTRNPVWLLACCWQLGSYPETGLEYINANLLEADFWTTSSESAW